MTQKQYYTQRKFAMNVDYTTADDVISASYEFETLDCLEIFANIVESEVWLPLYGLDSYSSLCEEINKAFNFHSFAPEIWESALIDAGFDYMKAWEAFMYEIERYDDENLDEINTKKDERYALCEF